MQLKFVAFVAGLAMTAVASAASAARPPERVEERIIVAGGLEGMDVDKDGAVSRAEYDAAHDRIWTSMDRNRNGRLDEDEAGPGRQGPLLHHPGQPPLPGRHRGHGVHGQSGEGGPELDIRIVRHGGEGLDSNKDGRVSLDEFTAPMREHFVDADRDRNGFLDKDEMERGPGRAIVRRTEKKRP